MLPALAGGFLTTGPPGKSSIAFIIFGVLSHLLASLITQLVKNPPAMQKTPVRFLSREDPLEKGKATHFSIPAWRTPCTV